MNKVKKVNCLFLVTVLVALSASFLPLRGLLKTSASQVLFSEIILVLPGAVYLIAGRQNVKEALRLNPIRLSSILWLFLFTVCVTPLMSLINGISMMFVENETIGTMQDITANGNIASSLILVALIPCIFEEIVYRGLFYREYSKVATVRGMVLSAFLFGIMHGNWNQFSYAFVMGIIFALVIEATDSILASMIMHFIINGTSIVMLHLYSALIRTSEEFAELNEAASELVTKDTLGSLIRSYLPMAFVGSIFAFFIYCVLAAGEGRLEYVKKLFFVNKRKEVSNGKSVRLITVPLLVGMIICVGIMIANELMP